MQPNIAIDKSESENDIYTGYISVGVSGLIGLNMLIFCDNMSDYSASCISNGRLRRICSLEYVIFSEEHV